MKYGAKGGKWAQMLSEGTTTVKPTYGEVMAFEGLNEFDETLNMATGSAHGDNQEMIYISEFSNGEGTVKAVYIPAELASQILGTQTNDKGGMAYRTDDNQPLGAYGFYRTIMDPRKNKYYEVNFYPKVQGSVEGANSKTKEDGVTLEYDAIKFGSWLPIAEIIRLNSVLRRKKMQSHIWKACSRGPQNGRVKAAAMVPAKRKAELIIAET